MVIQTITDRICLIEVNFYTEPSDRTLLLYTMHPQFLCCRSPASNSLAYLEGGREIRDGKGERDVGLTAARARVPRPRRKIAGPAREGPGVRAGPAIWPSRPARTAVADVCWGSGCAARRAAGAVRRAAGAARRAAGAARRAAGAARRAAGAARRAAEAARRAAAEGSGSGAEGGGSGAVEERCRNVHYQPTPHPLRASGGRSVAAVGSDSETTRMRFRSAAGVEPARVSAPPGGEELGPTTRAGGLL
jgi:hypothetical protein